MYTHNFNAGPSVLPREVFEQAASAILNFNHSGLSILEIGHRTPAFQEVLDEAKELVKELMGLNEEQEILFLHGGASTQFMQVPMNLLAASHTAAYLDAGVWGAKAIKEAKLFGNVHVVASSKAEQYRHIPRDFMVPASAAYFHYTTNNTVEGTQMSYIPDVTVPLVADMSSDIMSRKIDFNRFDLIYAGAQKNIGAAGVNLVVLKKKILGKADRVLPSMMDYRVHIENGSLYNTPPVFAIYVCLLNLRWLKKLGGVERIESINQEKAELLYRTIDALPMFSCPVAPQDRSRMNVVFVMPDASLEQRFLETCKKEGLYGVKGHRSVGGFRASLYNALPLRSVQVLCEVMQQFALRHG